MSFATFMNGGGWALFSIIGAVFSAVLYLTNQYLKRSGHLLIFWSRVLVVLVMTPFVAHLAFPADWRFYAAVALTTLFGTTSDIRTMNVSAKYGGGAVSRVQPLTVFLAFLLWFAFDPALLGEYAAHPYNTAGIVAALVSCIWFSSRLKKCVVSRSVFIEMLPALLGYTVSTVLNKYAMTHGDLSGAVFGYIYAQSIMAVLLVGGYSFWCESRPVKTEAVKTEHVKKKWGLKMPVAVGVLTFGWLAHMIFKNYAVSFTPNPSFQGALNLTAPLFIALFYRLVHHKEETDVQSGMGIVFSAIVLAILTVRR